MNNMTKIRTNIDYADYVDYYVEFSGKGHSTNNKEKNKDDNKGKSKDRKKDYSNERKMKRGE